MIKQDYIIRMIQEIISLIVDALLNKKRIRQRDWDDYDKISQQILGFPTLELLNMSASELIAQYDKESEKDDKIELAAVNMLKMAEDVEDNILLKSKLRQESLSLLNYLQENGTHSILREYLISLIKNNE